MSIDFLPNLQNIVQEQSAQQIKQKKVDEVKSKLSELTYSPIDIGGSLYDADPVSIKNVSGKLIEISSRESAGVAFPSDLMFWRDANNQTHTWQDVQSYKAFLIEIGISISERTTRLYAIAWQKEHEIDQLDNQSIPTIVAYDTQVGWVI